MEAETLSYIAGRVDSIATVTGDTYICVPSAGS